MPDARTIATTDAGRSARRPDHLHALTGIRIIAASWVLLLHMSTQLFTAVPWLSFARPVIGDGALGVTVFFMLSGFILTHQYLDRIGGRFTLGSYLRFLRLRLARIYPVHFVMLNVWLLAAVAATVIGVSLAPIAERTPLTYVENLFLVQSWVDQPWSWNSQSWSVSAEWFAYLLFPFAALALARIRTVPIRLMGIALAVVALVAGPYFVPSPGGGADHVLLRLSTAFSIGCLAYGLYRSWSGLERLAAWLAPIGAVSLVALCYFPQLSQGLALVPSILLILGLAYGCDPISKVLCRRVFVYGGEISYSLYMVHLFVLSVARKFLPVESATGLTGFVLIVLTVLACFVAAAAMYHLVEQPARNWLRGQRSVTHSSGVRSVEVAAAG